MDSMSAAGYGLPRGAFEAVARVLGSELPTLGIRSWFVQRMEADRRFLEAEVGGHAVPVKEGRWPWSLHRQPEFEDARRAAEATGLTLREVQEAAKGPRS